jgi:sialic acid synthase SpsE
MSKSIWIAEIGINHHGNMDKAFRMIERAKDCGATFAKFQFYEPTKTLGRDNPALAYAKSCYLSKPQHETLKRHCDNVGINYLVSVFDIRDVQWAASLCKAMKIATRMNKRQDFIREVDKTKLPVFMSVQPELTIRREYQKRFSLMWCVSKYPTSKEEVLSYPYSGFGLSSHCPDPTATLEAYYKGARVFENHLAESRDELGCDIPSSITFDEYKKLINACH